MKKLAALAVIISVSLFAKPAFAQTVDEIINKNIAAMGGREKILSLSTLNMTGVFTATGDTAAIPITVTKKHLIGSRIDITANNTNNYQLITPMGGWIFTPVQGDKVPRPLADDQFKAAQVQLNLHGPFINSKAKGIKVEKAGTDEVNGSMCYILKVTSPNNNVTLYYIDSKSGFIVKTSTKVFQFGKLEVVETTFSNYKQNAEGYWLAYENITQRGKTIYRDIVANFPTDDKIFKIK